MRDRNGFSSRTGHGILLLVALVAGGCAERGERDLLVFAAASLADALPAALSAVELERDFEVRFSFAGSSTLARQIRAGAPADLYLSASDEWMDHLDQAGLLRPGSRVRLLGNELVVVVPAGGAGPEGAAADAVLRSVRGRIAIAEPSHVPAGIYADQALRFYGLDGELGPRLAVAGDVRGAVALVARREAAAGIVYRTDVIGVPGVRIAAVFPDRSHSPISISAAVIRGGKEERAHALLAALRGPVARRVFADLGFRPPEEIAPENLPVAAVRGADPGRLDYGGIVLLSLEVALLSVVLCLPVGVFFGWILARKRFPGKLVLEVVCHLPLVLPPVVTGYVLLLLFGRAGTFGPLLEKLGLTIGFDWKGAALASAVVAFPLVLRAVRQSIEAVDPRLEQAARSLGARPASVFFGVTLPLALPGLVTGAVLGFARSLGEFGATITFVSNIPGETRTLPLAIYTFIHRAGADREIAILVGISVLLSAAALVVSSLIGRRKAAC